MDKRTFLKSTSLAGLGGLLSFSALGKLVESVAHLPAEKVAEDEDFWETIRKGYNLKFEFINLENGYYCVQPTEILEAYLDHIMEVNNLGAYYMRTRQANDKLRVANKLAVISGCLPEELVITRNTTESLDMIISGYKWKEGDEAVMAEQDYGAMLEMFKQVAKRHGVVNKIISIPKDPKSDEEIVDLYSRAITPKTRLLMVCHMINITGQILPVKKICDMAHSKNVEVMVDGAHSLAHINFKISELGCDYFGSSLHKWLSVPIGAGLLYVKKENIGKIWPLLAEGERKEDDISRLNHTGTHPPATDLSILNAIQYFLKIGADRKEARLRYLQNYWTAKVRTLPHIIYNTPMDTARSCGIANIGVKGKTPGDLADVLLKKYKIYTVAIDNAGVKGVRITPNIYTTTADLDALVDALKEMG